MQWIWGFPASIRVGSGWTGGLFIHCSYGCLEVQRLLEIPKFGQSVRGGGGCIHAKNTSPGLGWKPNPQSRQGGQGPVAAHRTLHKASALGTNTQALGHTEDSGPVPSDQDVIIEAAPNWVAFPCQDLDHIWVPLHRYWFIFNSLKKKSNTFILY